MDAPIPNEKYVNPYPISPTHTEYLFMLGEEVFCQKSFELRMGLEKDRNKAKMKERKKTIQHLQKYTADVS